MNPPRIEEAVGAVRDELASLPGVDSLVLFGSAARGTAGPESRVDLLSDSAPADRARGRPVLDR